MVTLILRRVHNASLYIAGRYRTVYGQLNTQRLITRQLITDMFPIETWNHHEAGACSVHCKNNKRSRRLAFWSTKRFFSECHHPTLRTFVHGIERIFKYNVRHFYKELLAHNLLSQSNAKNLKCVCETLLNVGLCLSSEILVYLRAIAHLSYS